MSLVREALGSPAIPRPSDNRVILGVRLKVSSRAKEIEMLDAAIQSGQHVNVAFANSHTLTIANASHEFRHTLQSFHVLNDGVGVDLASRIKFGERFPENLNGTDFIPHYFSSSRHPLRVFLLGARAHVVEAAAKNIQKEYPQHRIVGYHSGYFEKDATDAICDTIRESGADVLLVAMGNPLQEQWIVEHGDKTGTKLRFGVGALFDFMSGLTPRAPELVRRMRCEWIFRLALEPKRLCRRYIVENSIFLKNIVFDRTSEAEEVSFAPRAPGPFT